MKTHCELNGPEWIFAAFIPTYRPFYFEAKRAGSLDVPRESRWVLGGSLLADFNMTEFYWVLILLLRAEEGAKDSRFFATEELVLLFLALVFCLRSSCISWSILMEICLSWSESSCLFLLAGSSFLEEGSVVATSLGLGSSDFSAVLFLSRAVSMLLSCSERCGFGS